LLVRKISSDKKSPTLQGWASVDLKTAIGRLVKAAKLSRPEFLSHGQMHELL
jgi:hypothetical protein